MRNLPDDKVFVSQPGKRSGSKLITHKDYKLIVKLKAQGKTFDEISAITKLNKATVYKWIHADIKNR
jgi:DNA invertase Pin-like site-specific DNA recombinase